MKKAFISLLMCAITIFAFAQQNEKISLNEDWQFTQTGKNEWREAEVPGSVQRDLIHHGILPDPFVGINEQKIQWVEDYNWDFKKTFELTAEQLNSDAALLTFEGLDTHADVFLNGSRILRAENMFIAYEIPVKNLLREGENHLYIRFYSPIQHMMPARDTNGFEFPVGNDHREEKMSVFTRKAPFHFGWDWGVRIVQMGIWKPVSLVFYDNARISDYFVEQVSISEARADITNHIEIFALEDATATVSISVLSDDKKVISQEKGIVLKKGLNTVSLPFSIDNPTLWQPYTWGNPHLYDFTATVTINEKLVSDKTHKIGLRTINLIREKEENGQSFYFMVNGKPFFAKGANYIPGETLTSQQDSAYYERLFDNILAANMTMIRVWGGGVYEQDYFYQLAAEKGILIWQDFMFACTPYPHDDAFLQNVAKEAEFQVRRLRNNPSIALWVGNNEVEESIKYWGFHRIVPQWAYDGFFVGYDKLFRDLLPSIVAQFDPQKDYVHGSPESANWGRPHQLPYGDAHYWGLWYGREPFEILNVRVPRFMSEFGFQAFPEMKTIRTFAEESDLYLTSEVMRARQKASTGNEVIAQYMERYFHTPQNFEDLVYVGLVMQGEGMKKGMLAHRRNRPYCMGSLYWQLNDSWPVVSWSGIDYFGNWKALHYKTREAFAPIGVQMYLNEENGMTEFYVFSDKLREFHGVELRIIMSDFAGNIIKQINETVNIPANETKLLKSIPTTEFATEEQQKNTFVKIELGATDYAPGYYIQLVRDHFFFHWPKDLNLPETEVNYDIQYADGEYTVTLSSSKLAKNVFIEIPTLGARFCDNFFDLLPNETRVIKITSPKLKATERTPITVKHIRETY
ncbi:MAG: glycoside hydrolase family 2 protein [Dysgonamonadaceae bacterium]|jgi:beta-mannosidase|nr:glycoside hydrolase family 2 protein [Dysgonamonadaceae bacterium]